MLDIMIVQKYLFIIQCAEILLVKHKSPLLEWSQILKVMRGESGCCQVMAIIAYR